MRRFVRTTTLLLGLATLAYLPAGAELPFNFSPGVTYQSVDASVTFVQFNAQVRSTLQTGDELYVVFDPHLPAGWFAVWCQTSTGFCTDESAPFTLQGTDPDTLRVDFYPVHNSVGMGWVDIRIYRLSDPSTWAETTYALGHGIALPASNYLFRSTPLFQQADPWDVVQFFTPVRSLNPFTDTLLVQVQPAVPSGWYALACLQSTGTCFYDRGRVPLPPNGRDTLRVDFFCNSPDPAIGSCRIKTQSAANPAIWRAQTYRVMTGTLPSSAEETPVPDGFSVRAIPNPIRSATELAIALDRPSAVHIEIVDLMGRQVTSKTTGSLLPGIHRIRWDGTDDEGRLLPGGVYFYRVDGAGRQVQGKLVLRR